MFCWQVLIIENASAGMALEGWSCERLAEEFPDAKMRREYDWVKNPKEVKPRSATKVTVAILSLRGLHMALAWQSLVFQHATFGNHLLLTHLLYLFCFCPICLADRFGQLSVLSSRMMNMYDTECINKYKPNGERERDTYDTHAHVHIHTHTHTHTHAYMHICTDQYACYASNIN